MFYGRTQFKNTAKALIYFDFFSIDEHIHTDEIYLVINPYLEDTGLFKDAESLMRCLKYPELVSECFKQKNYCSVFESDLDEEDNCHILLEIAKHDPCISLTQVFTDKFIDEFREDINLLLGDLKTISSIFQ